MTGRRWLRASTGPLVDGYDAVLFDLDGVVYVGAHAVPGAPAAIGAVRASGLRVAFVTNNASRTPDAVATQLVELGVPAVPTDVVTSAQAAAGLVADRFPAGSPVLVVGGEGVRVALEERDLKPVASADDRPVAVVQGFSADLRYADLAEGAIAVRDGALFVASNLDRTLPTARGPLPGNGSLVELVRHATGVQPVSAGKPEPPLYEEAIRRVGAERPLFVGDRLDTDIEGAASVGADSVLVLTGLTSAAELIAANESRRPTYLASDLGDLVRPQQPVRPEAGGWACGGWTAAVAGDVVELTGAGGHGDGLRAVCAAAWTADRPVDATSALDVLDAAATRPGT